MYKLIKTKFIKGYWHNVVQTADGFSVVNTQRKRNQINRDGIGYEVEYFKTLEGAKQFLEKYER